MTFLASLWARFAGWFAGAGAILATALGIYLKGRSEGKAAMAEEQERHRREAIENKRKLDDEIDNAAPADIDRRAQRWVREE